jgi:F-type H+-transporting ATPase subunit alpha
MLDFEEVKKSTGEVGYVEMISHPIAYVRGLPGVKTHEVVIFSSGAIGWVLALQADLVEVLVFSRDPVEMGSEVVRTGGPLEIYVGEELLGHSVDALSKSLYDENPVQMVDRQRVDVPSLGIAYREKVSEPLETGVAVVDLTIPLGKGQRELVIGDRKTGKSEFLLQTLLTQARKGTICIYACIGKKKVDIKRVENFIKSNNLTQNCIVVASSSSDPTGLIYLAPYSAMTMAEYFRNTGKDVLLILDDLTTHAKFYREISLISKKFPGRSSYPGDIFFTHSRLLERAGNFVTDKGPVSITCLPVAETTEGDISGYIQTNIMSITDGHIYFDTEIFSTGRRPAVNYFLSVTRVGRQTQSKLRWGINRELLSFLTLYDKTQDFVHFGAELNEGIKATMEMGTKILNFFNQPMGAVLDLNLQIILFSLIWVGALSPGSLTDSTIMLEKAQNAYLNNPELRSKIDNIIKESEDFNLLLQKVGRESKYFLEAIQANEAR